MTFYDLAVIAAGIAMGFWLDRLIGPGRRLAWLALGAAALGGLLLLGQVLGRHGARLSAWRASGAGAVTASLNARRKRRGWGRE